jgi:hypothetical protein
MARTKEVWTGTALTRIHQEPGGTLVIPVRLAQDPGRQVLVRIPKSSIDRFLDAVTKVVQPADTNGRHHDEF